jgi:competence protein ComFB
MKLITKEGPVSDGLSEGDAGGIDAVEASVSRSEGNPLNYKTKLKIEIEPELEVRGPAEVRESTRIRQPRSRSVSIAKRAGAHPGTPSPAFGALREGDAVDSIPDGTPYASREEAPAADFPEGRDASAAAPESSAETFAPALERPAAPSFGTAVYKEMKAMREGDANVLKQAEQRREKKIQIESSLLNKSRSLINLSEVLTKELLPSVMERMDVCTCPVCTGNVLALALNTLPTKYVTTDEGKQYTQLEVYKRQNELDVIAALTRACVRVKNSPRHEIIDDLDE